LQPLLVDIRKAINGTGKIPHCRFYPGSGFQDVLMLLRQVLPVPDRLMMEYSVSQIAYAVKTLGEFLVGADFVWYGRKSRFV